MNQGYVKLWRKSIDAGWIKNHKLWVFWTYCLMKASHREFDAIVGLQVIRLMPGQFVFGRRKASEETGLSQQEIRTILAFLIKAGNLTIKTTNKFSIITIVNWHIYQAKETDNQPADQPTTNQQLTTYKNIRIKEKIYSSSFLAFWKAYPRKAGKDAAWRAWKKRNGDLPPEDELVAILEQHRQSPQWQDKKYIPHPATWLIQGRWQDETEPEAANTTQERDVVPVACSGCGAVFLPSDLEGGLCLNCRGARHER